MVSHSKRQTLRVKYKIRRKVAEHHRQQRKSSKLNLKIKLNSEKFRQNNSLFQISQIPNQWQERGELIKQIAENEENKENFKKDQNEKKKKEKKKKLTNILKNENSENSELKISKIPSISHFAKESLKIISDVTEKSSVVAFVLDARDPMGSRYKHL